MASVRIIGRHVRILYGLFDCGAKIGIGLTVGKWRRAWRLRNPFRRHLTDKGFFAGMNRWHWPVCLWARD